MYTEIYIVLFLVYLAAAVAYFYKSHQIVRRQGRATEPAEKEAAELNAGRTV